MRETAASDLLEAIFCEDAAAFMENLPKCKADQVVYWNYTMKNCIRTCVLTYITAKQSGKLLLWHNIAIIRRYSARIGRFCPAHARSWRKIEYQSWSIFRYSSFGISFSTRDIGCAPPIWSRRKPS